MDYGLLRRLIVVGIVVVLVLDINDNLFVFEYREYGVIVFEDIFIGIEVF